MPRHLRVTALAPAPATVSTAGISLKSLLLFMTKQLEILENKVIAAWAAWLLLRLLQSFLGPRRRRSRHWSVQYGAMAAYYLPTFIAFYAADEVYSSDSEIKLVLSLGCSVLLFYCARGADTMTAFTLGGGPHKVQGWRLLPWLLYFAWLQWRLIWSDWKQSETLIILSKIYYLIFDCIGPILYVVVAKPRLSILDYETKQFADYMMRQSKLSSPSPFFDAAHANSSSLMNGCKYPFKQKEDGRWITLSGALQQLPEGFRVDEDSCLAYILGRLLARRYFGFPCAEDGNVQVRDFVLNELLADNYSRAFTIVEVQLAVLHDCFFTNYCSNLTSGFVSIKQGIVHLFYSLLTVAAGYLTSVLITATFTKGKWRDNIEIVCAFSLPAGLIYTIIMQPQTPFLPRYWHPIQNLLRKTTATTAPGNESTYYWRDKLSQYSVIEDYDHRSSKKKIIAWCKVHMLSQVSYSFMKHHPAEGKEVSVPDSVRKLVASTVKDLNGVPTIGTITRSLRALDVDLSWTCSQETLTHTVLIWHIATCYCDMLSLSQPLPVEGNANHHKVATVLSGYSAYLVAFLPNLLPEHILTAKVVLQQVLQETIDKLGTTRMSMEEKMTTIQKLQLPQDESTMTTFEKGVRLGRQLEQQQPDVPKRWKAMAHFWAEMILYLAASPDNAAAHVEQLARGGEFITHVWALLCNAGIVKQAKEEWTP